MYIESYMEVVRMMKSLSVEMSKKEILALIIVIIMQSLIFVIIGINKSYIHMDEAYSLGLASYDKISIEDNADFYGTWHTGEYYEDYLSVQEDEIGEFSQVYINQKNDVHPPFYYLLLRIFMGFNIGTFSKWPGIILNIIIFAFVTLFTYLITKKIFKNNKISLLITFISAITISSLTNVIYIRMYALSTLNVLITTYLHFKLYEQNKLDRKLLVFIGLSALIGSLTHYYYLFYLVMLFIMFAIKYVKEKRFKELLAYFLTMVAAGSLSLLIFPYSINHMFFGYRGQGVISKLMNFSVFSTSIFNYLTKINYFVFNNLLWIILIILLLLSLYKSKGKIIKIENNDYIKIIILPMLFYFILVAIASPYIELRYILPICQLIFIVVIYYCYQLIRNIFSKKNIKYVFSIIFIIMLIAPLIMKIEPEVLFTNKKGIVNKIKTELNVPTVYFLNSNHNRFLDDIYLFSILDNSYIAKDINITLKNIKKIIYAQDLSKGILIIINSGQDNENILDLVMKASNMENCEYILHLNNSDVYYLSQ